MADPVSAAALRLAQIREHLQHQHRCPKVFSTKRWVIITHNEQHLDDDQGEDRMNTCASAICRAWAKSDDPACTCGLDELLADVPSAEHAADDEMAVIQHCAAHWFTQGGERQFGPFTRTVHNADELIAEILRVVRAALARAEQTIREQPALPDIELVSAQVHAAWMASKAANGVTSRCAEDGEELMAPYDNLSERAKELDRGTVRAVYAAIQLASRSRPATGAPETSRT